MHTVVYARLSNARSPNEPSIDYQITTLLAEAHKAGELCDPRLYLDGGDVYSEGQGRHSGHSLTTRKAMQALIKRIKEQKDIGTLRAFDLERVSRDAEFSLSFFKMLRKADVAPVLYRSPGMGVGDDANSIAMLGFSAVSSEYYRNFVRDMKRKYFVQARQSGWIWSVTAPCGLELVGSKEHRKYRASTKGVWLTEHGPVFGRSDAPPFRSMSKMTYHSYLDTVRRICECVSEGKSLRGTAFQLRDERYFWQHHDGSPLLIEPHHCQSDKLLSILPRYRAFLGEELVQAAMLRIEERAHRRMNGKIVLEPEATPLLSRLVYCSVCRERLTFSYHNSHNQRRKWGYYHHNSSHACEARKNWPRHAIEEKAIAEIKRRLNQIETLWPDIQRKMGEEPQSHKPAKKERRIKLERQLDNAKRHLVQDLINESDFRQFKREIEGQLRDLDKEPDSVEPVNPYALRSAFKSLNQLIDQAREQEPALLNLRLRDVISKIVLDPEGKITIEWKASVGALLV